MLVISDNASGGAALGECVFMPDCIGELLTLDDQVFLKSGSLLVDAANDYPDAFARFQNAVPGGVSNWTPFSTGVRIDKICTGNVTAGGVTTQKILGYNAANNTYSVSTDWMNWLSFSPPVATIQSICYFNGYFYLTGSNSSETFGTVNGRIWRTQTPENSGSWTLVCSSIVGTGESQFYEMDASSSTIVAMGAYSATNNANNYVTSTDGVTWTRRSLNSQVPKTLSVVNNTWVYFGINADTGGNAAFYSTNGTSWTSWTAAINALGASSRFNVEVVYANSLYVAVDAYGAIYTFTAISTAAWTKRLDLGGSSFGFYSISHDGTYFIAAGLGGIYYSVDGITWAKATESYGLQWLSGYQGIYLYADGAVGIKTPHNTVGISRYVEKAGSPLYMRVK